MAALRAAIAILAINAWNCAGGLRRSTRRLFTQAISRSLRTRESIINDDLKRLYEREGKLHNFFESRTPADLFRGRRIGQSSPFLQPTLFGWNTGAGMRAPDILVEDSLRVSPQYQGGDINADLVVEPRDAQPLTASMVANADNYIVKGCRTTKPGRHRGVSTFDQINPRLRNHDWIRIPEGTGIPPGLAVTRDEDLRGSRRGGDVPTHHTIAPKNDMPLSLFLQHLKGLEAAAKGVQPNEDRS
jgi:hypothetical protein